MSIEIQKAYRFGTRPTIIFHPNGKRIFDRTSIAGKIFLCTYKALPSSAMLSTGIYKPGGILWVWQERLKHPTNEIVHLQYIRPRSSTKEIIGILTEDVPRYVEWGVFVPLSEEELLVAEYILI